MLFTTRNLSIGTKMKQKVVMQDGSPPNLSTSRVLLGIDVENLIV
jgi:hypothetical protein